jgi:hypothetical protein
VAIYKTTYKVVVLSDGPIDGGADLENVLREMNEGCLIGETEFVSCDPVDPSAVHKELLAIGNDGTFFGPYDEEE